MSVSTAASEPAQGGLPTISGIVPVSAESSTAEADCALQLDLSAAPGAMIDLSLRAPCNMGDEVVIRHSGLAFGAVIGSDGALRLQVPALAANALVAAYVGSSEILLGEVTVPDMADYFRLAVHLPDTNRFDLRAEEDGRVFAASSTVSGSGAQRIGRLGQAKTGVPLVTQVYSVALSELADPDFTLEIRISGETCGRTLSAEIVESRFGRASRTHRDVAVPLCGTAGDILLLKNLLPDPTLAIPE